MSDYDYGPLRTYEITWKSGHIETVRGHQVTFDSWSMDSPLRSILGGTATETRVHREPRFNIHGSFDGHWRLVLSAPEAELHSLRDVTDREALAPGAQS